MRKTSASRTVVATSAACLALLVTACGGSDGGTSSGDAAREKKSTATGSGSTAGPGDDTPPPPGASDLKGMLVKAEDVPDFLAPPGGSKDTEDIFSSEAQTYFSADKPACQALSGSMLATPQGTPRAAAGTAGVRGMGKLGDKKPEKAEGLEDGLEGAFDAMADLRMEVVSLSSYEGDGAQSVIDGYKAAVAKCGKGFTIDATEEGRKALETIQSGGSGSGGQQDGPMPVVSLKAMDVDQGDDAVGWVLKVGQDGVTLPINVVAVRKGPVVVTVSSTSFDFTGNGKAPLDVARAQLDKLTGVS
ncbi:hypothetical protein ACFY3O_28180 [Streptomyces sp. NPDC001046]|uniref:hypothetical protein n=1 Tax=Streptomyces sp. NPDC001046 TaxID=3364543 RepID=UPI0036A99BC1